MFSVEMLPAENGDCLWIEYGDPQNRKRVLIDAGPRNTFKVLKERFHRLPAQDKNFELFIMTHYDNDHLDGILGLKEKEPWPVEFKDVWFNGWRHIHKAPRDVLGPKEGETFTNVILSNKWPWNAAFQGKVIVAKPNPRVPDETLEGGLKLWILSPLPANIVMLKKNWKDRLGKEGIVPGAGEKGPLPKDVLGEIKLGEKDVLRWAEQKFNPDGSPANGSSIAVLAEFEGKRALFSGDAFPGVLLKSIQRLTGSGKKLKLDLFKVSHHGSKGNINGKLLGTVDCPRYLISTNGDTHEHPNPQAIAMIVTLGDAPAHLYFNYRTDWNRMWDDSSLKQKLNYGTTYGQNGYLKVEL
ncbi:MAG: MBL fold metallo-hydrolase [Candidatus Aminicenantes bacterium]|nr:MBL fold metallo-hydrolase [Candidatus Aminicenantes bacterium]